ncbi:lanthionine synthetase LanC family protein [Chitinophaga nivalis]|uniref:Lanthionine synthetase n=1 Tax=Chitinophaga nivalis TaxID=2991709 RepID=A0ABT3IHD1_9BACT|nr:lanthionine synthetase LanC family protein [Chitinophaga nivalis]MCW3467135.1 hypothetical protein [Chitinophaga nivalis]MCW3483174.1 hypothetical protein [Chitinophaga nivalis]
MSTIELAGQKVAMLEKDLFNRSAGEMSVSLMSGSGGLALLYYNLYQTEKLEVYREKAAGIMTQIAGKTKGRLSTLAYGDGLTGIAALFSFFREKGFTDNRYDPYIQQWDGMVYPAFFRMIDHDNLDYLHGALGVAAYLLDRYRAGQVRREQLIAAGTAITMHLNSITGHGASRMRYMPAPESGAVTRYINCGMAHGLVSVMIFLSKYYEAADNPPATREAIRWATDLLLTFRSKTEDMQLSVFPAIVKLNGQTFDASYDTPLGWCYGDAVVAMGLYHAARVLRDHALSDLAIRLAMQTTLRTSRKAAIIQDGGFCHGSAGLAHIYKKWFQWTGMEIFRVSYEHWIHETLRLTSFERGIGGFLKYDSGDYRPQFGLLDGACGVALVLSDYVHDGWEEWDRFFLLS